MNDFDFNTRLRLLAIAALTACLSVNNFAMAEEEAVQTDVAVQAATVQKTTLRAYLTCYGSVVSAPALENRPAASARLAPYVSGLVAELLCAPGQRVEKGQVLIRLDTRTVDALLAKTRQAVANAEALLERQKKLMAADATTQKALQEAELQCATARAEVAALEPQLGLLQVSAPLAGTVTKVSTRVGETVDTATPVIELADLDRLVAAVAIPVDEVASVHRDAAASVLAEGMDKELSGKVIDLSAFAEAANGSVTAWVELPPKSGLRPGQFVSARIVTEERADRLAVPVASVVKDADEGDTVAVIKDGKATRRAVMTGLRDKGLVEVSGEGLAEGMTVVAAGAYGLPKETKVRVEKQ